MFEKAGRDRETIRRAAAKGRRPGIASDMKAFRETMKSIKDIEDVVMKYRERKAADRQLRETREMIAGLKGDDELRELAALELAELETTLPKLDDEIRVLLQPKDPYDDKNVFVEVRAGTGGDEATLFAAEIVRMYTRYAELRKWKVDLTDANYSSVDGFKDATLMIQGDKVYSRLKYESGVHRSSVFRRPRRKGRIHTSAITVAVLPEADDIDIQVNEKDIRIDTFCSSGPGGQSVNNDLLGRAHDAHPVGRGRLLPGREVADQEPSEGDEGADGAPLRNRATEAGDGALRHAQGDDRLGRPLGEDPHLQLPAGPRHDHRIGLTVHNLPTIMDGFIDNIIEPLINHFQAERLREAVDAK